MKSIFLGLWVLSVVSCLFGAGKLVAVIIAAKRIKDPTKSLERLEGGHRWMVVAIASCVAMWVLMFILKVAK